MTKQVFGLVHQGARQRAVEAVRAAPEGWMVTVGPAKRTLPQNARMWACLTDISEQVQWHGRKLDPDSWKAVFTSALKKLDVVPNLDGTGFVVLGLSTSKMTKRELSDLMEIIGAFGAERGVRWTEPETETV